MAKHFILTLKQAELVRAESKPGNALLPAPCSDGTFLLPCDVLLDPTFAALSDMLTNCDRIELTDAQFAARATNAAFLSAKEKGWDATADLQFG